MPTSPWPAICSSAVWIALWLPKANCGEISTIGGVRRTNSPSAGLSATTVYGHNFGVFEMSAHQGRHAGERHATSFVVALRLNSRAKPVLCLQGPLANLPRGTHTQRLSVNGHHSACAWLQRVLQSRPKDRSLGV